MAITYSVSTNTITVTGYTSAVPCTFLDIYNADKAGTLSLHARTGITGTDGSTVAVDRAERPADYIVLGKASNDLGITITNWIGTSATIRIIGTDRDGAAQTEDRLVAGNGTYYTTKWFKTITHTQVTTFTATSFDYDLTQGQWGVVSRQCTNEFCFDAYLYIGDGSTTTWFADTKKRVFWNEIGGNWVKYIEVKNNSYFRLGTLVDDTKKSTRDGCAIAHAATSYPKRLINAVADNADIQIYSSQLANYGTFRCMGVDGEFVNTPPLKIYNSTLNTCALNGMDLTLYNVTITGNKSVSNTYGLLRTIGTTDIIKLFDVVRALYVGDGNTVTYKNVVVADYTVLYISEAGGAAVMNVINGEIDEWKFVIGVGCVCYRQYEFDLKVVDSAGTGIDSAKTKIWDKDDSLVTNTTTNSSGVLATQTLNYGYYNSTGGNTPITKTPHEMRIYEYGKKMLSSKSSIEAQTDWALTMSTDDHITQTTEATVAAYTGITINHTAETITISENHTLDEIYDYCQYDIIAATKQLDQTMHTADGVNFVSEYSFVVNTGITVTATDQKLSMVSGETYTLTGTAQFTGIIATTTTTRIPIKLTNIVDSSRYWVGKESDGSTIFEGTQSGSGDVFGYYEHTANINVDIRVRKSSASVKYLPWIGEGVLLAEAFSLRIRQIQDGIIT